LRSKAGLTPADVRAIRERQAPREPRYAALSAYGRDLIEQRGHVGEAAVEAFLSAGFKPDQALEALAVSTASTITNYALNIAEPPLEPMFQAHAWRPDTAVLVSL
jgi:hypothetical protein